MFKRQFINFGFALSKSHNKLKRHCITTLFVLCVSSMSSSYATPITNIFDAGQDFILGLPDDIPASIRYLDTSNQGGSLSVEYNNALANSNGANVENGFRLLDGTLNLQTSAASGRALTQIRMQFDGRALRRAGIRVGDLRLMRFDVRANSWVRARRLINDIRARTGARFFSGRRADFTLGHFGVDLQENNVWGVMDVGGLYAIGVRNVSTSTSWGLLLLGLSSVLFALWRQRHLLRK